MLFSWEEKSRSNNSSRIQLNFYHSYRSIQPASHFLCAYLVSGCSGGRLSKVFQTSLPHQQRFPDPPGGDPEAFWGQMTYAVPPARSGSAPGGSSRLAVPWKSLQREAPGRILIRCPNHLNRLSFFFWRWMTSGFTPSSPLDVGVHRPDLWTQPPHRKTSASWIRNLILSVSNQICCPYLRFGTWINWWIRKLHLPCKTAPGPSGGHGPKRPADLRHLLKVETDTDAAYLWAW